MSGRIDVYETMSALSGRMVQAARANDWDRLSALEKELGALRNRLMADTPLAGTPWLDAPTRARKLALVHKILADDREIRSHTEPWMEAVKKLFASNSQQRAIHSAYGIQRDL